MSVLFRIAATSLAGLVPAFLLGIGLLTGPMLSEGGQAVARSGASNASDGKTISRKKSISKSISKAKKRKVSAKKRKVSAKKRSAVKRKRVVKRSKAGKRKKVVKRRKLARGKSLAAKSRSVRRVKSAQRKISRPTRVRHASARPTLGTAFGLHRVEDPLSLRSSVAYVFEPSTQRVLFSKNSGVVLPIASITKLMTAIVVLDARQSLTEMLTITRADIDRLRGSSSRLAVGTRLSRGEMLQLALMSSANRAANALGRHYPGGLKAFVSAMNAKARLFGMTDTQFADPSGLSGANVSSATDLARLVAIASDYPLVRQFSTATGLRVDTGYRRLQFHNTNRLIANDSWSIGLQKTGFIDEAGRCLVMQARIDGRDLVIVLLDSAGSRSRFADAVRIKKWLLKSGPQIYAAGGMNTVN